MKHKIIYIFITVSLIILSSCEDKLELNSGIYGWLEIAIDNETNTVTGYYSGKQKESEGFYWVCEFYFNGKLENNLAEIIIHNSSGEFLSKALLEVQNDTVINISSKEQIDADCLRVLKGLEYGGVNFYLTEKKNWIQIRVISEKSFFYTEPIESKKTNSYLISGDRLYLTEINESWVFGEFYGKKVTKGWLLKDNLHELRNK